jgi:hypothetical protein
MVPGNGSSSHGLSPAAMDAIGYTGGCVLAICLVPQIGKIVWTRSARDISYAWSVLYLVSKLIVCCQCSMRAVCSSVSGQDVCALLSPAQHACCQNISYAWSVLYLVSDKRVHDRKRMVETHDGNVCAVSWPAQLSILSIAVCSGCGQ